MEEIDLTAHCLSGRRQLLVRATVYRTWYYDSTSWEPVGTTPTDTIRVPNAPTRYRIEKPGYRTVFAAHLPVTAVFPMMMLTARPFILEPSDAPNPEMVRVPGAPDIAAGGNRLAQAFLFR